MGFGIIEVDSRGFAGPREYRLAEGETAQARGIETRERMKRIAFEVVPRSGCVDEAVIEVGVVSDEDGTFAAVGFQRLANLGKQRT